MPTIRPLDPFTDLVPLQRFYEAAPDYWLLADGKLDTVLKASEFFTDCPPDSDPAASDRLGLFLDGLLSGVAEVSYGFPTPLDAYLGLMLLGPWARGAGHGQFFLRHCERLARTKSAPALYLAVLEANPRGRAFWEREGFRATGKSGRDDETGHVLHRMVKPL
jgi:GNAT superfamily N-acetyltransferase